MLEKMMKMEIAYTCKFSQMNENEKIIRFRDENLPGMYTHNFTLIKNELSEEELISMIRSELEKRKQNGLDFLRVELNYPIDKDILTKLPLKPEIVVYDYMYLNTDNSIQREGNPDCQIIKADTPNILKDGIEADIRANKPIMGEFAEKRIARKAEVYSAMESNINLYVCYHHQQPIGTCELMIRDELAKIEDFDIIEVYQRKGFGTSVLKHLVEEARQAGVKTVYLITEKSDTAKEMYSKCGFAKLGEKTELFLDLTK